MTVSTLTDRSPDVRRHLLPTLDRATSAVREAHEAARALTDTVVACWSVSYDISYVSAALTAATRAAATATRYATANPTAEHLRALDQATAAVLAAAAAVRDTTYAVRSASAGHMRQY